MSEEDRILLDRYYSQVMSGIILNSDLLKAIALLIKLKLTEPEPK